MKVLVVDDRPENVYLLVQLFKSRQCEVETASNGFEALKKARIQKFDLIISDIMMPEMDGFLLCHSIKTDDLLKNIPFVFYTATYTDAKDEALALSLGANAFIVKPMEPVEFLREIEEVLHKASQGKVLPHQNPPGEAVFLKQYNERLIHKLEDKVYELEETNQKLTQLTRTLEERVQASRAELLEKNQALEAFTYSVSHDLRGPLRIIGSMASILRSDLEDKLNAEQKQFFQRLEGNTQRMQKLINDLLEYSKIANLDILLSPVALETVLDRAVEQVLDRLSECQGTIDVIKPLPKVIAYEPVLIQVFTNLLDNALKFVSEGTQPKVNVSAEMIGDRTAVTVQDNGIGIAPEICKDIFKVFERGTADNAYSGTGVGLAIVQKGVERMGGSVSVSSTPGQGSSFRVELQLAQG